MIVGVRLVSSRRLPDVASSSAIAVARRTVVSSTEAPVAAPVVNTLHSTHRSSLAAVYSPTVRIVPRGMSALAMPDSDAAIEALADAYVNLRLTDLNALHRSVIEDTFHLPPSVYEEALLKGFGGGGVGGALPTVRNVSGTPASAAVGADNSRDEAAEAAPLKKPAVEKSSFDVKLASFPPEVKIKLIKELRTVTNLALGDAKAAIDKCPGMVQTNMGKDDAERLKKAFEAHGASVELL